MFRLLLATQPRTSGLVLRLVLALVMFPHGAQKAFGMFGGLGFQGTLDFFSSNLGISKPLTVLVIAAEVLGSIGLAVGLWTRIAAAGIAAVMVGAIFKVHLPHGLFMDWYGSQGGHGYEFHLLAIAIATALVLDGGGLLSIDHKLSSQPRR